FGFMLNAARSSPWIGSTYTWMTYSVRSSGSGMVGSTARSGAKSPSTAVAERVETSAAGACQGDAAASSEKQIRSGSSSLVNIRSPQSWGGRADQMRSGEEQDRGECG